MESRSAVFQLAVSTHIACLRGVDDVWFLPAACRHWRSGLQPFRSLQEWRTPGGEESKNHAALKSAANKSHRVATKTAHLNLSDN